MNIPEFYPTPKNIVDKMLSNILFWDIKTVLEPSAGKGNIIENIIERLQSSQSRRDKEKNWDVDAIEINNDLRHILKGKSYRVIHDDFLTFQTQKKYDLIAMNPPFSDGDKHLLKALELQQNGGKIVCILNAETINNPFSNTRKDLMRKLEDYNAKITFVHNAFAYAERKTDVEIAIIEVDIPRTESESVILTHLRQTPAVSNQAQQQGRLISGDFIQGIVDQYNFEVAAGVQLINEYLSLTPLTLRSFDKDGHTSPILELTVAGDKSSDTLVNAYIKKTRYKYWEALFKSKQFTEKLTTNLLNEYLSKIDELKDYDFSLYNIYQIRIDINKTMIKSLEETILNLFEELSHKHHWYNETSRNIHYYDGWKTNKAYKINKKVIIPLNGFGRWNGGLDYIYNVKRKLLDIEKVFNYLDGGLTEHIDLEETLKKAQEELQTQKIKLKYFTVTFYKKGTCHIEFTNLDLLKKFNLYGSQRKGWLPPTYGKERYEDMAANEKAVVDSFEGKQEYEKTLRNREYYICDQNSGLLMLESAG